MAYCGRSRGTAILAAPTSPTFINLLLLSGAYRTTHPNTTNGHLWTEPMPKVRLSVFTSYFPLFNFNRLTVCRKWVSRRQIEKLGLALAALKVGGEGFSTRVVDGILQIKARSAMLGYLNVPNPFTQDGWLITGDLVEVDGDTSRSWVVNPRL